MARKHTFSYICDECTLIFQTFGYIRNGKPFCPKCGDYISVKEQQGLHKMKEEIKNLKTRWCADELALLNRCVKGHLAAYQVAIMTGRTIASVSKKLKRVKDGAT